MKGLRLLHMSKFMSCHLAETEYSVLTAEAVIVRLFSRMCARVWLTASLGRRVLLETGCVNRVQFLMLPSMSHYFIRIRAHEIAF